MKSYRYVILGGGMVAGYAAQKLVELGLQPGDLAILSADRLPPYERPPLSKGFLAGKDDEASVQINQTPFYREHGIDLQLDTEIERTDLAQRRLRTSSGEQIGFEKLLIATGARARTLQVPGSTLNGVHYLRSLDDSKRIRTQAAGAKQAVVVGSGFIGMEVTAVLCQQGLQTTMLFPGGRVWESFFTPPISAFFQRYYEQRGVTFVAGQSVAALEGQDRVAAVLTKAGRQLEADLVVAGIGAVPATEALAGAGLRLDNGVEVNEFLETEVADVFAAGDIANYYDVLFRRRRRAEHWDNAVEQGRHAAQLLTGEREPFVHVPYFFSDVFDLSYEFWGDTNDADQVIYRGAVESGGFSAWWLRQERLVAATVMNRPDEERELAPLWIAEGRTISPSLLENEKYSLRDAASSRDRG